MEILINPTLQSIHQRVGHMGASKTLEALRRDFFWPCMARDVDKFVQSCLTCPTVKARTGLKPRKMLTPHVPCTPLTDVALDFVGPLPAINSDDMVLTVTFWLSGFTRLIPINKKDTAAKTASRVFTYWI